MLFALRVLLALVAVPPTASIVLSLVVSIIFVAAPIAAMFGASSSPWTPKLGLGFLLLGAALHGAAAILNTRVLPPSGLAFVLVDAAGQFGLLLWCQGLGALLAQLIKDKNLVLPIALFLAGFDMFLVFAPVAPTHRMVREQTQMAQNVLMKVPKVQSTIEASQRPGAHVVTLAMVGPADLFFMATFFVCMFRFGMRTRQTVKWLTPVVCGYLLVVIVFGGTQIGPISLGMLPAMAPIGCTVLLVNRREFAMQRSEKALTWVVAAIALGLAAMGFTMAIRTPEAPLPEADGAAAPAPAP